MSNPTSLPPTKGTADLLASPGEIRSSADGGMVFAGGATRIFSAMAIRKAIQLYASTGIIMTRGMTINKLLRSATNFTGKRYTASKKDKAIADLTAWIDGAKAHVDVAPSVNPEQAL